jgi:hypothetical protein
MDLVSIEEKLAQLDEYETRLLRELKKVRKEQDALRGIRDEQVISVAQFKRCTHSHD